MPHAKTLRIEDLLGSKIVTSEGKTIGHVVDIQITSSQEHKVTDLVFGKNAWLYRWHVLRPFAKIVGLTLEPATVPWDAVKQFEKLTITLKPGYPQKGT